jgi:hypothetical protein
MKRILLDQNVPEGVRRLLSGHDVRLAYEMGWAQLDNGRLLDAAEKAGVEVLVTCDQNLSYQQTIPGRAIGLVVLSTNRWAAVRTQASQIATAIATVAPGAVITVRVPRAPPR